MAQGTDKTEPAEQFSPEELREYHQRIKHHIKLMERVSTDLDVVDLAYKLGNWVEMAGLEREPAEQKLSWLLTAFERIVVRHFDWEEKHLLPRFDERGAIQFSQKLVREHREAAGLFQDLHEKIAVFEGQGRRSGQKAAMEATIKAELKHLLSMVEAHAMDEEDAFFMVDHNI